MPLPLLYLVLPWLMTPGPESDWPQWRGPERTGRVVGEPWPADLSAEHLTPLWRLPDLGPSYSGPLVLGDTVFTTETKDGKSEAILALDRSTGDQRWRKEWPCVFEVVEIGRKNGSWIRSTPVCDGEAVYVAGMRELLLAFDARTGEERWRIDFPELYGTPVPDFGCVASPLVSDGALYIPVASSFCKVDTATGKVLWRVLEGKGFPFACPTLATIGGRELVVVQMSTSLHGVDPETGQVVWSVPVEANYDCVVTTPVVLGDSVYIGPYGKRSRLIEVLAGEKGFEASDVWESRVSGYMSTAVTSGEHLYVYSQSNRFSCIALIDGQPSWISPPTEDEYWSLVAQGDRILALAQDGVLRLVAAAPEAYRVIDEVKVSDAPTWAHLTVAGDELFIREQEALTMYRWR